MIGGGGGGTRDRKRKMEFTQHPMVSKMQTQFFFFKFFNPNRAKIDSSQFQK